MGIISRLEGQSLWYKDTCKIIEINCREEIISLFPGRYLLI